MADARNTDPRFTAAYLAALHGLGMKELRDVRDVLHVVGDVLGAMLCQPRFKTDGPTYNDAGDFLDSLLDLVSDIEEAAVKVAREAKLDGDAEDEAWRQWTILSFEADLADDLSNFAVLAAEAVRDESEAIFNAKHKAEKAGASS